MIERLATASIPDVVAPVEQCCYCWYKLHQDMPYPEKWSSTICTSHAAWLVQQLADQRAERRAAERARVVA